MFDVTEKASDKLKELLKDKPFPGRLSRALAGHGSG